MPKLAIVQSMSNVARAKQPLLEVSPKIAIEALVRSNVEACSEYHGKVVACEYHPLVAAVHAAFSDHRPLVLSPDMLWLLIAQGLARHLNANSENMRRLFVQHDEKERLIVTCNNFVKGSPRNPWSSVFGDFSAQIGGHIGKEHYSNIVASFSTTGAIEKAANEIVLMGSLKSYFEYVCRTMCGIPEVQLEGTAEDWDQLPGRTKLIGSRYDLAWWTERIVPILERIARNAAGANDPGLWNSLYKLNGRSGGVYIDGWLADFFPYLQATAYVHRVTDKLVDDWDEVFENEDDFREEIIEERNWRFSSEADLAIDTACLPGSLCKAPFTWQYFDDQFRMEFLAGFIGFTQNPENLAVRPKIGWAVREA